MAEQHKRFDLLTLGEILLRLSPPLHGRIADGDMLERHVGGAELNVAAGVAQLGLRTGILSKLPQNELGAYVRNRVRFSGVSEEYLTYEDGPDARLGLYYYESGASPRKPAVVYDRKNASVNRLSLEELPEDVWGSAAMFHTCGISLALSPGLRAEVLEAIRRFKAAGARISFDVNYRANLWDEATAKATISQLLPLVDVLFVSEESSRRMFGKTGTLEEIMRGFGEDYGIQIVAATRRTVNSPKSHDFTSMVYDAKAKAFYTEEPYRDIDVIDRIGSGDSYVAGMLFGLLKFGDAERALRFGNAMASVKCTIPGDLTRTSYEEIKRITEAHGSRLPGDEMSR